MKNILLSVSESDDFWGSELKKCLGNEGYNVIVFTCGDELYRYFVQRVESIDMVLLNVDIPSSKYLNILRDIRAISLVPVILLSSIDYERVTVRGLKIGCDDVMVKPISTIELCARIEAVIRRSCLAIEKKKTMKNPENPYFDMGGLRLSQTEHKMLGYLMENIGSLVTKEELLSEVWGIGHDIKTRVTDDTLKRIRRKISDADVELEVETVRGIGYILRKSQ